MAEKPAAAATGQCAQRSQCEHRDERLACARGPSRALPRAPRKEERQYQECQCHGSCHSAKGPVVVAQSCGTTGREGQRARGCAHAGCERGGSERGRYTRWRPLRPECLVRRLRQLRLECLAPRLALASRPSRQPRQRAGLVVFLGIEHNIAGGRPQRHAIVAGSRGNQ